MVRLVMMRGRWYSLKIDSVADDLDNIEAFTEAGEPVLLCYDLTDAQRCLGPDVDIEVVD